MPLLYCLSVLLIQFHSAEIGACSWSARLANLVVIRTSICYVGMNSCRKDIHQCVQVNLALSSSLSPEARPPSAETPKNLIYKCPNAKRVIKRQCLSNSCCFLLLLVCSAKDLLLRMAQHEWLSLDFILVHGHASFYSERGAERHSREKPG